jgi:ribosomal protein L30
MKKNKEAAKKISQNVKAMEGKSSYNVTQVRSEIGTAPQQKLFLKSLGLRGIGTKVQLAVNLSSTSLIKKVIHLIKIEA